MTKNRSGDSLPLSFDEQQLQPPLVMGGDGSHGPGVLVSTEQTRREENLDDETVTLQLQHPSSNDDKPILCSVVCNRRAIRASSTLIRNLLDNMGRDDEVLPPFSTEHIADELTLRRVVEFATVEASFGEDVSCVTNPAEIEHFRQYVKDDGHRDGVLNLLLAAHYLCCNKLKNTCVGFLASAFNDWRSRRTSNSSPGAENSSQDDEDDPLAKLSLPILVELTDHLIVFVIAHCNNNDVMVNLVEDFYCFSQTLFESLAHNDAMWTRSRSENEKYDSGDEEIHCANLVKHGDLSNPDCPLCLLVEQRLQQCPSQPIIIVSREEGKRKKKEKNVKSTFLFNERWRSIVEVGIAQFVEKDDVWEQQSPSSWPLEGMDLSAPNSIQALAMAERTKLAPSGMIYLPPLSANSSGCVPTVAECWREFYHFATHDAERLSISLGLDEDTNWADTAQLDDILANTTKLHTLHIRKPSQTNDVVGVTVSTMAFPLSLKKTLNAASITTIILDEPSAFLYVSPPRLKRLRISNVSTTGTVIMIFRALFSCTAIEHLELHGGFSNCVRNNFEDLLRTSGLKQNLESSKRSLCIYFNEEEMPYSLLQYHILASYKHAITFHLISRRGDEHENQQEIPDDLLGVVCKRFPTCPEEGQLNSVDSWVRDVKPPNFFYN